MWDVESIDKSGAARRRTYKIHMAKQESVWDWVRVLRADPSRADEFDGWDRLGGFNIARILSVQPQLARYCDLSKLKPLSWIRLLRKQPQFVAQCDKWEGVQKYAPELFDRLLMEKNAPSTMLDYVPLGDC